MRYSVTVATSVILISISVLARAAVEYTLTDLGTLGGTFSCGCSLNSRGEVVGYSTNSSGLKRAYLYSNGTIADIGTPVNVNSYAYGINDNGQIVGKSGNHAFFYSDGTINDIGTLGGDTSVADSINDTGHIVGSSMKGSSNHAFFYSNGAMTDLGTMGYQQSYAESVNSCGQVVGFCNNGTNRNRAFLYSDKTMTDLGDLGGNQSSAGCINDFGQVVGWATTANEEHRAFLYSNGTMTNLGTLGGDYSTADAINDSGQVVGFSYIAGATGYPIHAFLYDNETMTDLNDLISQSSGWTLISAVAINDNGWIVCNGLNASGQGHAILLTPIPEPSTVVLLGMGGIGLIALSWRRRKQAIRLMVFVVVASVGGVGILQADVCNMGGTRNADGTWIGLASLEFVTVGDTGNVADSTGYGAVGYNYQIGKYDVTVAQYTAFLNAVARTDTYDLYNSLMGNSSVAAACGISRNGGPDNYTYSITKNGNYPVNYISWGDAARFCNWLSNGQPTGDQGPGITETGAYTLNGATSDAALMAVTRNAGTTYFIPSEDEWYKAAYYKGGGTNAGYWLYPTKSNTAPINTLPDTGNHANFYAGGYTDPTNRLTAVGAFSASPGPYGTYDQSGNVSQWNEANNAGLWRGVRGGSFINGPGTLASSSSNFYYPKYEDIYIGFRVASVPEPSTLALLGMGGIGLIAWGWRRKR